MPDRTVIVVPTYNEAENLPLVLERLLTSEHDVDVLVVDDSSPDGTGDLAEEYAAREDRVKVLHRTAKSGLGDAYIEAFQWALGQGYDVVGQMDADGSHQPEELHRLRAAIEHADVVIGSRWIPGGTIANWPRSRELLSRAGNIYIRRLLEIDTHDVTAGFRLYRAEVLRKIELSDVRSHGYCFQTDLTRRALLAGFSVAEVPIEFVERESGVSKMSSVIVVETIVNVTWWGLAMRAGDAARALWSRRAAGRKKPQP